MSPTEKSTMFSFASSEFVDELYSYTEAGLSELTNEMANTVTESFVVFAQQLQETGLPICDAKDFEILNGGQPIGYGATMTVFKAFWKIKKEVVAIKRINLGVPIGSSMLEIHNLDYNNILRSLFLELRVMNHPSFRAHSNFVDLLGVSWDPAEVDDGLSSYRPSLIVELADENTPTLERLLSLNTQWNDEYQSLTFDLLTDVAEGVTMLHATKIVHGDLKPENVLLFPGSSRLVAKISDFGFCSPFVESRGRIGGTCYWNAPECMSRAPETIKPFAKTLTRDLYSYGLIVWRCLFGVLPYGHENCVVDDEIQTWKLEKDLTPLLRAHVHARVPGLQNLQEPKLQELTQTNSSSDLLWFQIWNALFELLRPLPNERNMSVGVMHRVFKLPTSRADVFFPQVSEKTTEESSSRFDDSGDSIIIRPSRIVGMSEGLREKMAGKYNADDLMQIPKQLQRHLLEKWEEKRATTEHSSEDYLDLTVVLSTSYRAGFGTEKDPRRAREMLFEAARAGLNIAQMEVLSSSLLDGNELPVSKEEKNRWLKEAMCTILFPKHATLPVDVGKQEYFRAALESISPDRLELSLLNSFIRSIMTEWKILNLYFGNAAEDPLFGLVVRDEWADLKQLLTANPKLIERRMEGFTMLHVAADYCHEDVIRALIQEFKMSPNVHSDDGQTPIESAALSGSVDGLLLLFSLGASSVPLADQHLFTSVAITGTRESSGSSPISTIMTMFSMLCDSVEELNTNGGSRAAVQALLDGRYNVDEEGSEWGSPLELTVSVYNYDSVIALLKLGANPNLFNSIPPLCVAISIREPILACLLLSYGADPMIRSGEDKVPALHYAKTTLLAVFYEPPRNDLVDYREYLPEGVEGVDLDDKESITSRVIACIDVLLHFGADLNACCVNHKTALMQLVMEEDFEVAEYLLQRGAKLYCEDDTNTQELDVVISDLAFQWCNEHDLEVHVVGG